MIDLIEQQQGFPRVAQELDEVVFIEFVVVVKVIRQIVYILRCTALLCYHLYDFI